MPASPIDPGPVDRARIDLNEEHELRYWTQELDCTAHQLLVALQSVGVNAGAVAQYLGRQEAVACD